MLTVADIQEVEKLLLSSNEADIKTANELFEWYGAKLADKMKMCIRLNDCQSKWHFTVPRRNIRRKETGGQLTLKF